MSTYNNKAGFSLVEIMVSAVLLAVLAAGGAATIYHTGISVQDQEVKRMAVDQAMERMELVKRTRYPFLQPPSTNDVVYYFVDNDQDDLLENGELTASLIPETAKRFSMITRLTHIPLNALETEHVMVDVSVTYGRTGEHMVLESLIIP